MTINKDFYLALNEMVSRAAGVDDAGIVDEKSFIDFGRTLSDMDIDDFRNAFANEIANKIRLSLDIVRKYNPKLMKLFKGSMPAGGILEIIQHSFMELRAADFTQLIDGTSPDMFIISNSAQNATYFIGENAFSLCLTISDTELEGAFISADGMARFLDGKVTYMLNSYALGREQGRRSLLAVLVNELNSSSAASTVEDLAQNYKLVTLYNAIYTDATVTSDDCLYNSEFVKFAIRMINKVYNKLGNPSTAFNEDEFKTFTPDGSKMLITLNMLDNAIVAFKNTISPEATVIPEHDTLDFWQKAANPAVVSFGDVEVVLAVPETVTATSPTWIQVAGTGKYYKKKDDNTAYEEKTDAEAAASETETDPVIAVLFDDLRLGEYTTYEKTLSTPINARAVYYNIWQHYQGKLVSLKSANAVIFSLA